MKPQQHNNTKQHKTTHMKSTTLIAFIATVSWAGAHVSYTGRNFGSYSPGNENRSTALNGNVSSTFGWAYSTDDDLGDSHRNRAFRFTLLNAGEVTISVQRTSNTNPALNNILLPSFSIYSGLAHLPPNALSHDSSAITQLYLSGLAGTQPKQGAFFALGDWQIGNDPVYNTPGDPGSGVATPASLVQLTYQGHAADGTSANFGTVPGINGDGTADGFVTGTFNLAAGDYTIMIGGSDFAAQGPAPYSSYNFSTTLSVVPEPSTALLGGIGALALLRRRRK
jgi:hypothetical protein